ncbi:transmembrane and tetratricopeptidecontaining 4 [Trypanosoma theileri]|uniref:Transmembrane and tetratricopeptidecontaining 4 n=1 Tax=Trypanosoma theileri TaxID=67003 RepID=A0A1X0NWI5_9TRYP|nr:transmembrane and tetratricopeptidecontaining 4 [Trypanosoma theileri]ORC89076.1 transmembrane and tetratricopeptidecontaining 4 [Trypanosoma theileri]
MLRKRTISPRNIVTTTNGDVSFLSAPPVSTPFSSQKEQQAQQQQQQKEKLFGKKDFFFIAIVITVSLGLYAKSLKCQFTFDDHLALIKNQDAHANSQSTLWDLLQHDYWGNTLHSHTSNRSFRPFTVLTFRLQHWLSGYEHSAYSLRTVNILFSILNGICVYILAAIYFPRKDKSTCINSRSNNTNTTTTTTSIIISSISRRKQDMCPTLAMILFMLHPVHTDAVVSVVGRAELLYCFFGFCAFFSLHFLVLKQRPSDEKVHPKKPYQISMNQVWGVLFVFIFTSLSVFSKESGITFAALFMIHAIFLYLRGWISIHEVILTCAIALLLILNVIMFRQRYIGSVDLSFNYMLRRTENPQYFIPPGILVWLGMRFLIQMKNMELLFFPTQLCCEYSYNCIPLIETIWDRRVAFMILFLVVILYLFCKHVWRVVRFLDFFSLRWLLMSMWIIIPYMPVSHLLVRVGTFIAERCLYVPSIGAVLLIIHTLMGAEEKQFYQEREEPKEKQKHQQQEEEEEEEEEKRKLERYKVKSFTKIFTIIIFLFLWAYLTYTRIDDWYDDESLFRSAINVCPNSGKAHFQLASAILIKEKNQFSANTVALFQKAYKLDNELKDSLYYLAIYAYNEERNPLKALRMLRECSSSPYTMSICYPIFNEIRRKLFPKMTKWEILEDNADMAERAEEKAEQYRLAGLLQLQMKEDGNQQKEKREKKYECGAAKDFRKSLNWWNTSKLYWFNDRIHWETVSTFCNTLYWYTISIVECLTPSYGGDINTTTLVDEMTSVVIFISQALSYCDEKWDSVPLTSLTQYTHRPSEFSIITTTIHSLFIERILPAVAHVSNAAQVVRYAAATASVRHYCYLATLVKSEQGKRLSAMSSRVMEVQQLFHKNRELLLLQIEDTTRGLPKRMRGVDVDLGNLLHCSRETSSLFNTL